MASGVPRSRASSAFRRWMDALQRLLLGKHLMKFPVARKAYLEDSGDCIVGRS